MPPGSVSHIGDFNWPTGVGPVPYLGAAAPPGWYMLKPGQGFQLEAIADYPTLFALFGNRWGGDGVTTFAIPQAGWFTRGQDGAHGLWSTFGEDAHTLTVAELPPYLFNTSDSGDVKDRNWTANPAPATDGHVQGQGQAHNNVPKTLVVNLIIKT